MSEALKKSIAAVNNPESVAKMTADELDELSSHIGTMRGLSSQPEHELINQQIGKLSKVVAANLKGATDEKTKVSWSLLQNEIIRTTPLQDMVNVFNGNAATRTGLFISENPQTAAAVGAGLTAGILGSIFIRTRSFIANVVLTKILAGTAATAAFFGLPIVREWIEGRNKGGAAPKISAEELKKVEEQLAKQVPLTDKAIKEVQATPANTDLQLTAQNQITEELRLIALLPADQQAAQAARKKTLESVRLTLGQDILGTETTFTIDGREFRGTIAGNGTFTVNGRRWKLQGFGISSLASFTVTAARRVGNNVNATINGNVLLVWNITKNPSFNEGVLRTLLTHMADRDDTLMIPTALTDGKEIGLVKLP